jgi:hypothetical protein
MHNTIVTLIIDPGAATARPDAEDMRTWMSEQRVFISSVMSGMEELRLDIAEALRNEGATPVYFEDFGGRDDDAEAAYLGEVATSTIYVGVLGAHYGRIQKSRMSATHEEYREAERLGLHISVWADSHAQFQGDQVQFLDEVRLFHTTGTYSEAGNLGAGVGRRLRDIGAADLSPWVKIGDLVFRAHSIQDNGKKLTLRTILRDPLLLTEMERLRPGGWGVMQERRLTFNGQSIPVVISSVETHATTSRTSSIDMKLERTLDTDVGSPMSISIGGRTYSSDQVTNLHFRRALFGAEMPRSILMMGGRVDDPFEHMPAGLKSDELRRAVMRLLITESLILSGRASRVTKINISPGGPSGHKAVIAWAGPTRKGRRTEFHEIEGTLALRGDPER